MLRHTSRSQKQLTLSLLPPWNFDATFLTPCDFFAPTMTTPHWVYASELTLDGKHGHPLYRPQPTAGARGVMIGDMGYIEDGAFYRIINTLTPSEDPERDID